MAGRVIYAYSLNVLTTGHAFFAYGDVSRKIGASAKILFRPSESILIRSGAVG